jgi:transcriptional regulator GlxA family with amidase domain
VVFTVYAEPLLIDAVALQDAVHAAELSLSGLDQALRQCPRRAIQDPRIERALAALDAALVGKVPAASLAAHAHLSLSQLERLFASQVGLPVRRLVLWRRLRLAMALVLAGKSVTDAAHGAGFADSAHFSRTLKALFGVTARQALQGIELRLLE